MGLQYRAGAFGTGLGYSYAKDNAAGSQKDKAVALYASYDFGAAKLTGYFNRDTQTESSEVRKLYGARVDVPLSEKFVAQASLSQVKNISFADNDNDAKILGLKGTYSLSKRTAVYGLFTYVSNDDGAAQVVSAAPAVAAGKNSRGLAVGVRHAF